MNLDNIKELILKQAKEKGFGTKLNEINVTEKILLLHSEISEAYDSYRKKNIEGEHGFKEEMADVLIRTIHLCAIFDIDIEQEILKKLEKNQNRVWDWKNLNENY